MTYRAHLVFLRSGGLLIVKRPEDNWRQLQDLYSDYMASLGPYTAEDIVSYFADDYGDESQWPFSKQQILDFFNTSTNTEIFAE